MRYVYGYILLLISFLVHAEVYKWTDSQGTVHFSDTPRPGAEIIQLPKSSTFKAHANEEAEVISKNPVSHVPKSYEIAITAPEDLATIRNPQGFIPVTVQVTPALTKGQGIQLLLDEKPLNNPVATMNFELRDINRGSHTLAAQLVDAHGEVIKQSSTISFFMQQPRINMGRGPGAS